ARHRRTRGRGGDRGVAHPDRTTHRARRRPSHRSEHHRTCPPHCCLRRVTFPPQRSITSMTRLLQDVQFAVRTFRRTPVFTGVAVLSLALGIGANSAIFTLADQLLLRLLPVRDPEQVVILSGQGRHYGGNNGRNALAYPMYQDIRSRNQVFSAMMCRYRFNMLINAGGEPEVSTGELVSGNYFPLLGLHAAAGRLYTASDDLHAGAHPYAVLSFSYWQTRFGGRTSILGQTIRVNNYPLTVVGVAQPGFDGIEPGIPARIFVPLAMAPHVGPGFRTILESRRRWVNED